MNCFYPKQKKQKIEISDEELQSQIKFQRENLPNDKQAYEKMQNYIKGLGISEDEYWKSVEPIYEKLLIIGKLKNSYLKEEFMKSNKNISKKDLEEKFRDYYEEYKANLLKNSKVEYFLD